MRIEMSYELTVQVNSRTLKKGGEWLFSCVREDGQYLSIAVCGNDFSQALHNDVKLVSEIEKLANADLGGRARLCFSIAFVHISPDVYWASYVKAALSP